MATFLLLSALAVFIIFLLATRHHSRRRGRAPRRPPGPKGLPFIGNIHQVDIPKLHIWLTKLSNNYGPLLYLKLCRLPVVVISSADAAKKALKHNDIAFAGRPTTSASIRFSYDHNDIITSPHSDYWRKMRKVVVHHLFSPQKLRSFRLVREDEASSMIVAIAKRADLSEAIDVGKAVLSFNCNVLCRVAFGKRLNGGAQSLGELEKIILTNSVRPKLSKIVFDL